MKTKLIHLRITAQLYKEINQAVEEFGFQSAADFLRESARKNLHEHEVKRQIKKGLVIDELPQAEGEEESEELPEAEERQEEVEEDDPFSRRGLN
jgi:Arc/MetJ-type ribon-helix-helix transcriptional regulator